MAELVRGHLIREGSTGSCSQHMYTLPHTTFIRHLGSDKDVVVNDVLASELSARLVRYHQHLAGQQQLHESRGLLEVLGCVQTLLSDTLW